MREFHLDLNAKAQRAQRNAKKTNDNLNAEAQRTRRPQRKSERTAILGTERRPDRLATFILECFGVTPSSLTCEERDGIVSGNVKHSVWLAFIWFSLQSMGSAELFAEDAESKRGESDTGNIGFMKNPPAALLISYDISFYRRQGRLNEIVNRVRHGNVEGVLPMVISYNWEVLHVHPGILLSNNDFVQPLLSDHQQTVCVAYPNGKRAWIAQPNRTDNGRIGDGLSCRLLISQHVFSFRFSL